MVCESDEILVSLIKKFFPDFRRVIGELQKYSSSGKIDTGILAQLDEIKVSEVVKFLKVKDFAKVRTWVSHNSDGDATVYRALYDSLQEHLVPASIPEAILILADYQYKSAFVVDQEINLAACLIQMMVELEFK